VSIDISAYVGEGVQFRFNRLTGGTWRADVGVDNISVTGSMSLKPIVPAEPGSAQTNLFVAPNELVLYPNPARDILQLSYPSTIESYRIFNMYGQVVLQGPFSETIDVSLLRSGSYFIEISAGEAKATGQFIVE
jgi:hypothetical protein